MRARPTRRRYCRCGTHLATDNTERQCARCQRLARDKLVAPPEVPTEFWRTEQFRDAFAAQHIGRVSRVYRMHPYHHAVYGPSGISQTLLGEWVGVRQPHVSRIENGPPILHLDTLRHWARVLRIPAQLLWFTLPGHCASHERLHVEEPSAVPIMTTPTQPLGPPVTSPSDDPDVFAMQGFRAADKQVGGGHLYATVVKYLHTEIAPRLFGDDAPGGRPLYNGAAALTEMAGWMAHDAGRDSRAQQHFSRSLDLVKVGGDRQLSVHILASMSHLAHHRDQPERAIQFARRGHEALACGPRQPALEARLLAMQALGFAALREAGECTQILHRAEKALTLSPVTPQSRWVSHFDEGSLASEAARCMRQLGDLSEAQRQAGRIIELRSGDRTRSRAFGQLILCTVLIDLGELDKACALARDVLEVTQSLGSFLVIQELRNLGRLLQPHRADKVVADFLDSLDQALRERVWLYQWLRKDGKSQPAEPGEGV